MYYRPKRQVETQERIETKTPPERPRNAAIIRTPQEAEPQAPPPNASPQDPPLVMEGVYIISVAARILETHPQTLRKYERLGLINPGRTIGMLRLYSRDDIRKVRLIQHLVNNLGMNLAGVEHTLGMVDSLLRMKRRLTARAQSQSGAGYMQEAVEQELSRVFQEMNLPVDD
jgi:MerR family transcriptional regulator/heat shock protein HspR